MSEIKKCCGDCTRCEIQIQDRSVCCIYQILKQVILLRRELKERKPSIFNDDIKEFDYEECSESSTEEVLEVKP